MPFFQFFAKKSDQNLCSFFYKSVLLLLLVRLDSTGLMASRVNGVLRFHLFHLDIFLVFCNSDEYLFQVLLFLRLLLIFSPLLVPIFLTFLILFYSSSALLGRRSLTDIFSIFCTFYFFRYKLIFFADISMESLHILFEFV